MDANKAIKANFNHVGGGTIVFATNCEGVKYTEDKNYDGKGTFDSNNEILKTTNDILYRS